MTLFSWQILSVSPRHKRTSLLSLSVTWTSIFSVLWHLPVYMCCTYSGITCHNLEQCCALGLYVPVILRHCIPLRDKHTRSDSLHATVVCACGARIDRDKQDTYGPLLVIVGRSFPQSMMVSVCLPLPGICHRSSGAAHAKFVEEAGRWADGAATAGCAGSGGGACTLHGSQSVSGTLGQGWHQTLQRILRA